MTQAEFGEFTGYSTSHINGLENGKLPVQKPFVLLLDTLIENRRLRAQLEAERAAVRKVLEMGRGPVYPVPESGAVMLNEAASSDDSALRARLAGAVVAKALQAQAEVPVEPSSGAELSAPSGRSRRPKRLDAPTQGPT